MTRTPTKLMTRPLSRSSRENASMRTWANVDCSSAKGAPPRHLTATRRATAGRRSTLEKAPRLGLAPAAPSARRANGAAGRHSATQASDASEATAAAQNGRCRPALPRAPPAAGPRANPRPKATPTNPNSLARSSSPDTAVTMPLAASTACCPREGRRDAYSAPSPPDVAAMAAPRAEQAKEARKSARGPCLSMQGPARRPPANCREE
mmetsp:Transcript_31304/g.87788  ORF Transcript_31304/g.87788 Transcript_31304/m.87788 type:complete len:208 (+) Transcript_31304:318-941(+)